MVFSAHVFLFAFLPLVLGLYALAPRRARSGLLLLASIVFYGWWRLDFALLMLGSVLLDYTIGLGMGRSEDRGTRRRWLLVSLVGNLGALAYFKYANFGIDNLNALLAGLGWTGVSWPSVVLPVGISFYTFQTLSYTIDVYRREVAPQRNLIDFACYVTLFPQLVAGPIVRYSDVADQLRGRTHTLDRFARGALGFELGLAKKVLLADQVAPLADRAFETSALGGPLGAGAAWIGVLAYAFQIYFDFSAYSDMAIGLGRMIGFEFMENFDAPYKSTSITEFWRRWHISLSTWLRDYLYVPLGGNRAGRGRTYVNLAITMLLGGLWHGASWNFVAWGAWHGAWLVVERLGGKRAPWERLPRPAAVATTFLLVLISWVFFRAPDFGAAGAHLAAMFGLGSAGALAGIDLPPMALAALALSALIAFAGRTTQSLIASPRGWLVLGCQLAYAVALLQVLAQASSPFLYFRF